MTARDETMPDENQATSRRPLRVFFVLRHLMYLRNYESTLRGLAAHGHQIVLGYEQAHDKVTEDAAGLAAALEKDLPGFELRRMPDRRDFWTELTYQVRALRNYLRYLTPRLRHAVKCARRAEAYLYPPFRRFERLPLARRERLAVRLSRLLYWVELSLPLDRSLLRTLQQIAPDVIAVTPLVDHNSMQAEYLKVGRRLGIPTVHCVASWDNLTNKGVVPLDPDRMLVWNEPQRAEAVELHGVKPECVVVTGAQLFDPWFERRPSRDRTEFCRHVGLDPERPYLLYTCSSVFIARYESLFVKRWLEALRSSEDPGLQSIGVLIRPHPGSTKFADQWDAREFRDVENVAVYPRVGGHPVREAARADYFDSLYHAVAIVGINTSAMLEAGILGKRCYTVLDPQFSESQEGMVHFAHLTRDGFLVTADGFDNHLAQLAAGLTASPEEVASVRRFVGSFLRPQGIERPSTPLAVAALESASTLKSIPLPTWPRLLQPLLLLPALFLHVAASGRSTKKWDKVSLLGHAGALWSTTLTGRSAGRVTAGVRLLRKERKRTRKRVKRLMKRIRLG